MPKELTVYSEPNSGLTERVIYCAGNAKASTIATGLRNTSIRQIAMARKAGYTVCLMTAASLNDIIAALQKNPDYILCSGALDLQKVKTILLSDHSGKFTPVLSPIDWDALPADCVLNYDSAVPRSTGTALRVMSYNILAQCFDEQRLASMRVTDIARTIGDFAPDIAGLQELDLHWYANLDTGVLKSLKFIHAGITPYPPSIALLYNSQRFRVVENGFVPFTDKWIRAMIWAVLEDLGDGRRFIIANTHWDLTVPKR
ncbi:MAG: hypothetical protein J6S21_01595, partial [Victivallales bacterium]|nr:hypothetical protein [Victivallales bacterium]